MYVCAAVRDAGLQALDGFVLRCPHDARAYLDDIVPLALRFLSFDPNYAEGMDEEEGGDGGGSEEDDEE
jgi:cullin-associated NEDD8-dissociated protein 1